MNTPDVDAGRLERQVRRVGRKTIRGVHRLCSLLSIRRNTRSTAIAPYGLDGVVRADMLHDYLTPTDKSWRNSVR